jgi:hypothetical protein
MQRWSRVFGWQGMGRLMPKINILRNNILVDGKSNVWYNRYSE